MTSVSKKEVLPASSAENGAVLNCNKVCAVSVFAMSVELLPCYTLSPFTHSPIFCCSSSRT